MNQFPVMETFYSLQGEGRYSGYAAYFIRLGGCDVGCHWCDVKESWKAEDHPNKTVDEIISEIPEYVEKVIVTGGEPLMWDMSKLTQALQGKGFQVHLETSGAYPLTGHWDWVCLSPKKRLLPKPEVYTQVNELKVIIYNQHDFMFAESQAKLVDNKCLLYLQPEWSKKEEVYGSVIEYIKNNPKWQLSLQTHKYLGIE